MPVTPCELCPLEIYEVPPAMAKLPSHMWRSVHQYIHHHWAPEEGDFLEAVICNDLKQSVLRADDVNQRRIFEWVSFFYMHAPHPCWGSPERMEKWVARIHVRPMKGGLCFLTDGWHGCLPEEVCPGNEAGFEEDKAHELAHRLLIDPAVRAYLINNIREHLS